jgi:hypothetical protein
MKERHCQECGEILRGRIDQRFCSDQCRTTFHNRQKVPPSALFRQVNGVLRKNYRILRALNPTGKTRISGEVLRAQGFNFHYFTHQYRTRRGDTYSFVYEQGYLPLEDGYYVLVVNDTFRA